MPSANKRSLSVERRRVGTPRPNSLDFRNGNGGGGGVEMSAAQKLLLTSTRSLSVSFQGESYALRVSKAKPAPSPAVRKGTPERRKASTPARGGGAADHQMENSKPVIDQQRWPGRLRQANCMSRSFDLTDESKNVCRGSGNVVRSLQNSMVDSGSASVDSRFSSNFGCNELVTVADAEGNSGTGSDIQSDRLASDSESVSSGSNSEAQDCGHGHGTVKGPRRIVVPARFWQETNKRLRRPPEPGSPSSKNVGTKSLAPSSKLIVPKKFATDSPVSSPRGVLDSRGPSPIRGPVMASSPSRLSTSCMSSSPSRGMSPSRARNATVNSLSSNGSSTPSILNFANDIRRGKIGETQIVDAHLLRLLYNRLLQWRFVNARADAALSAQRLNAERSLYNAWISTLKLRESVRAKRYEFQLLKQKSKLTSILKWQMIYLEECDLFDHDFSISLSGVTEALRASTLRLPVIGGAKADIRNIKDAIHSAVDVTQALASSIGLLLSKVEVVNSLVQELADVSAKERGLLDHVKDHSSTIAAMQVKECSHRAHRIQNVNLQA